MSKKDTERRNLVFFFLLLLLTLKKSWLNLSRAREGYNVIRRRQMTRKRYQGGFWLGEHTLHVIILRLWEQHPSTLETKIFLVIWLLLLAPDFFAGVLFALGKQWSTAPSSSLHAHNLYSRGKYFSLAICIRLMLSRVQKIEHNEKQI